MGKLYSVNNLRGIAVWVKTSKKQHRIGKVHSAIFHPRECKLIGFSIKRPDVALMFHRGDKFMPADAFVVDDNHLVVDERDLIGAKALAKRFSVDWDECLIWQGMSLLTEKGIACGQVGDVIFSAEDGSVRSLAIDRGSTHNALIGKVSVSASEIKGFKLGVGKKLNSVSENDELCGALIVSDEVLAHSAEGGLAEKAGATSAKIGDKVGKQLEKAKPAAQETAQKAGEAVNKGAFALGEQLAQAKGMFANFKEEYNKAYRGEQDD